MRRNNKSSTITPMTATTNAAIRIDAQKPNTEPPKRATMV